MDYTDNGSVAWRRRRIGYGGRWHVKLDEFGAELLMSALGVDFRSSIAFLRRRARLAKRFDLGVSVLCLVLIGSVLVIAYRLYYWSFGSILTVVLLCCLELILVWHIVRLFAPKIASRPRIVPYFSQKHFDHSATEESRAAFQRGYDIAADLEFLDALAAELKVAPLSEYGFADDLFNQPLLWAALVDGVHTLDELIKLRDRIRPGTLDELLRMRAALSAAMATQRTFALLVRYWPDEYISGAEMSKRQGTFWC